MKPPMMLSPPAMDIAVKIGKVATLVGVCPGFVGNRILAARQRESQTLVNRGVLPWDVDAAFNSFGFKMGPFQMSDLAGLDIGWKKGAQTGNPIRDRLCEMDRRGQKPLPAIMIMTKAASAACHP